MNGRSRSTIWLEISDTVISQDDTSAAATRNMTMLVVRAAETKTPIELREFQFAVDAGGHEQRIDGDHHGGFGRREDSEAQADDDDGGQHQRPEAVDHGLGDFGE